MNLQSRWQCQDQDQTTGALNLPVARRGCTVQGSRVESSKEALAREASISSAALSISAISLPSKASWPEQARGCCNPQFCLKKSSPAQPRHSSRPLVWPDYVPSLDTHCVQKLVACRKTSLLLRCRELFCSLQHAGP